MIGVVLGGVARGAAVGLARGAGALARGVAGGARLAGRGAQSVGRGVSRVGARLREASPYLKAIAKAAGRAALRGVARGAYRLGKGLGTKARGLRRKYKQYSKKHTRTRGRPKAGPTTKPLKARGAKLRARAQSDECMVAYSDPQYWEERSTKVTAELMRQVAETVLLHVLAKIPNDQVWAPYKQSLELVKVNGVKHMSIYAVRANTKARKVTLLDAPKTVLYVRSKKGRLAKKDPKVEVLQKYSPWTLATLPFHPDPRVADVISQKVSAREVQRVGKQRSADKRFWRRELDRLGVRPTAKAKELKPIRTIPDVAFEALRLEFGLGGIKAKAHWRPAIRHVVQSMNEFMSKPGVLEALLDPNSNQWRRWPKPVRTTISMEEARKFAAFQKRLGLGGTR